MAEDTLSDKILDDKPTIDELTTHARTAKWNELGIKLTLDDESLGQCNGYDSMYQLWLQEKGDGATRRVLIKALRDKNLNNVADNYVKYLKTLGGESVQTSSDASQHETKPTNVLKKAPGDAEGLLNDLRDHWNMIGIALKVDSATLETLKQSPNPNDLKLADVIKAWINTKPSPVTWETLINAIEGPPLNQKKKANEIRNYLGILH